MRHATGQYQAITKLALPNNGQLARCSLPHLLLWVLSVGGVTVSYILPAKLCLKDDEY